jgi:succinate-semialdehyde dehydrogenase/glutarate-semialdehyde dehydrogenase
MKKGTFELGGNDPFIVLKEADVDLAVEKAYVSRMATNGQACINAKRFIINETRYDEFKEKLLNKIDATSVIGDPMDP